MSWNSPTFQPVWPSQLGLGPRPTLQGLITDRVEIKERESDSKPIPKKMQRNAEIGKYILQGQKNKSIWLDLKGF